MARLATVPPAITPGPRRLWLWGPIRLLAHEIAQYTLTITGDGAGPQPEVIGGLNVRALDGGVLAVVDAATQLSSGQITHTAPKDFSGNTVSWLFEWEAPAALGSYDLTGWGNNANDSQDSGGDYAGVTTFTVQVVPIPAAVWLFGSALGLLGWLRRKAT